MTFKKSTKNKKINKPNTKLQFNDKIREYTT